MNKTIYWLVALLIITGTLFSGCANQSNPIENKGRIENVLESDQQVNDYESGTYSELGAYQSPAMPENIKVDLTLENDVIAALTVTPLTEHETSINFQTLFSQGINQLVVGKNIDEIERFTAVNGSSLTPVGFQQALEAIKAKAKI